MITWAEYIYGLITGTLSVLILFIIFAVLTEEPAGNTRDKVTFWGLVVFTGLILFLFNAVKVYNYLALQF